MIGQKSKKWTFSKRRAVHVTHIVIGGSCPDDLPPPQLRSDQKRDNSVEPLICARFLIGGRFNTGGGWPPSHCQKHFYVKMQNAKCKGAKEGFGCFDKWSRDRSVGCKYFLRPGLTPSPWPLASFFCRQCSKDKALVWRSTNTSRRPIWAKMPSIGCCPCCPIFKWLLTGYCRLFSPKHGK